MITEWFLVYGLVGALADRARNLFDLFDASFLVRLGVLLSSVFSLFFEKLR